MPRTTHMDTNSQGYGRPLSIEELSNRYVIHPLSSIVANFAISLRLSANFVSLLGLGAGLLAAVFYYHQAHTIFVVAGFMCMALWHVFDGADGRVARATGTSSPLGRIIDGICDHLVFGSVYFAFVFYILGTGSSKTVWFWAIAAAISHGIQAAGYEERRQKFQRRCRGETREEAGAIILNVNGRKSILAISYDYAQKLVSGKKTILDIALGGLETRAVARDEIQNSVNRTAIIVRAWALLNANNRTIMIAVMAVFERPGLYFKYEVIVLNAVLIGLLLFEHFWEIEIAAAIVERPDINI